MKPTSLLLALALFTLSPAHALAGGMNLAAEVYLADTKPFLKKTVPRDSVSVKTYLEESEVDAFRAFLKRQTPVLRKEGSAGLGRQAELVEYRKKAYISDVSVDVGPNGIEASPRRSTLQWGMRVLVKPVSLDRNGALLVELDSTMGVLLDSNRCKIYDVPLELPQLAYHAVKTQAVLPGPGALVLGGTIPEFPGKVLVLLLEVRFDNAGGKASLERHPEPFSLTRWTLDLRPGTIRSLQSKHKLPDLPLDGAVKASAAPKAADLVFSPWAARTSLVESLYLQRGYIRSFDEEMAGGRRAHDPIMGMLRLGQAWKVCTEEADQKSEPTKPFPFTAEVILLKKPVRLRLSPLPRLKIPEYGVDSFSRSGELALPQEERAWLFLRKKGSKRLAPALLVALKKAGK